MHECWFTLDGIGIAWPAVSFGEPWNGFLTPVVREDIAEDIAYAMALHVKGDESADKWAVLDDGTIWITPQEGPAYRLPVSEGLVDLGGLGYVWTRGHDHGWSYAQGDMMCFDCDVVADFCSESRHF